MGTMKTYEFYGSASPVDTEQVAPAERIRLVERDTPVVNARQVLVQWRAAALNYRDYMVVSGEIPVPEGRIPLADAAGEVVAVGEAVTAWEVGDRVMSRYFPDWEQGVPTTASTSRSPGISIDGYACQFSAVEENQIAPLPNEYSFAEAATLPCAALTAWCAVFETGNLQIGQSLLIEGSGGVSLFALQFAKAAGARVYAATSSSDKVAQLEALGADRAVNYRKDEQWGNTVYDLAGEGVDQVVDIGAAATLNHAIDAACAGGLVTCVGFLGGTDAGLAIRKITRKRLRLAGVGVGSMAMQKRMVAAIENTGIKPVIDRTFPFEQLPQAMEYQVSGGHIGKIVLGF